MKLAYEMKKGGRKMYNLTTNMADRINFDQMVTNYLREIKFIGTPDEAVTHFQFEEGMTEVDDIEEATERIKSVAKRAILNNLADEIEDIKYPLVIYDTGAPFDVFINGKIAADRIRRLKSCFWAMGDPPTYTVLDADNLWNFIYDEVIENANDTDFINRFCHCAEKVIYTLEREGDYWKFYVTNKIPEEDYDFFVKVCENALERLKIDFVKII